MAVRKFVIKGRIINRMKQGVGGLRVEAWDKDQRSADDALADAVTNADGTFDIAFSAKRATELKPDVYFRIFHGEHILRDTKNSLVWSVERTSDGELVIEVETNGYTAPVLHEATGPSLVSVRGAVMSDKRAGTGGLIVRIVDKNVGEDRVLAETITDSDGSFRAVVPWKNEAKEKPDLQAVVSYGKTALGASEVRYNAGGEVSLDVVVSGKSGQALPSEYETLTAALSGTYKGALRDLRESGDRRDVTFLANKSGWDARAVAMAALADQFSAKTQIKPAFFYALFRAGLPADENVLYLTGAKTVAAILSRSISAGVIPVSLKTEAASVGERFPGLATNRLMTSGPEGFKELLAVSLGADTGRQQIFATLYAKYNGDPDRLWKETAEALGTDTALRLQTDGKLAILTGNDAGLVRKIQEKLGGITDTARLVDAGLYNAKAWKELGAADADVLAAKVRLSYPTAVMGHLVKTGALKLAEEENGKDVHSFLSQHHDKFHIGAQPVAQYVKRSGADVPENVVKEVTRLQRVYQISPGDAPMSALLAKGLDSAYAVSRYTRAEFVKLMEKDLDGGTASLVHAKAQQVHHAVLNVAMAYLTAGQSAPVGVHSPPAVINPAPGENPNSSDLLATPTLEKLLGGMDYCECQHCRSVLSPAAYFVDLLVSLNNETVAEKNNPQVVLFKRRPDLQFLPLTCENTNVQVPYIDLVNEVLEYFVYKGATLLDYQGHSNDGTISSEELQADPQFVEERAYDTLSGAVYPPPLPFNRPLERQRRYFDKLEAPLASVMQALSVAWTDVAMEELRMSRKEHELLTDKTATLNKLYGYDGGIDAAAKLLVAKTLAERLHVSLEELVAILRTRFVNPQSAFIPKLERLGVPFDTIKKVGNGDITEGQFNALLPRPNELDLTRYEGDAGKWVTKYYAQIKQLVTLTNPLKPEEPFPFEKLELRYLDDKTSPSKVRDIEFVRLHRFVRLWRKLGLTIEQTDKAITALYPKAYVLDGNDDPEKLKQGMLGLIPRLGAVKRVMSKLSLDVDADLLPLLACFAEMDAQGSSSLYAKLFLSPTSLSKAVEPNSVGEVMTGTAKLLAEGEALRAAFGLTAEELALITGELKYDANTTLTLERATEIYRRAWLARKLDLSIGELLALVRLTEAKPFEQPDAANLNILALLDWVERLAAAQLEPSAALYLMWNTDLSGESAPKEEQIRGFARGLRADLAAIEADFTLVDDPEGKIARQKMSLVYSAEAVEVFFGLLSRNVVTDYDLTPGAPLDPKLFDVAPGLSFDDLRKKLVYKLGVMPEDDYKLFVNDANDPNVAQPPADFKKAVKDLYDKTRSFFVRYPELKTHYETFAANKLDSDEVRRSKLLKDILPGLRDMRKRQQILQALAAVAGMPAAFVSAVMESETVLGAADDKTKPAFGDLKSVEQTGLTAVFYSDADGTVVSRKSDFEPALFYANLTDKAGTWTGFIEAPQSGDYNVNVEVKVAADAGASVELVLGGQVRTMKADPAGFVTKDRLSLAAGTLYPFELKVKKLTGTGKLLAVKWETQGRGREIVPSRYLYPDKLMKALRLSYVRFLKLASLAAGLKLTAAELSWLAAQEPADLKGWTNVLPADGEAAGSDMKSLTAALSSILDFALAKAELSPKDEKLLAALKDSKTEATVLASTGWDQASYQKLLTQLSLTGEKLADPRLFRKMREAFGWMGKIGVSAVDLIEAATNVPTAMIATKFQAAVRARHAAGDWLKALKPLNDELRRLQRDALIAYILHGMKAVKETEHINTPERLFEYFLMDVQMEPVTLTSRVRHAISSVQLFIDRALMNLEGNVSPASIKAEQWRWMSRYRVWEANRKVLLWPENWLEPELRDDQSPFFKEALSELLQGDITEERASVALLNYLAKLDEVAHLEPCGVWVDEGFAKDKISDDVVHVVARTSGANRKHYYRRLTTSWTPWEEIKLDIEDNPVRPVKWKNRLFLFWLRIQIQSAVTPDSLPTETTAAAQNTDVSRLTLGTIKSDLKADAKKVGGSRVSAVLCWSEYYNGKWQQTKTSDIAAPAFINEYPGGFDRRTIALDAYPVNGDEHLRVMITNAQSYDEISGFLLYNTHSLPLVIGPDKARSKGIPVRKFQGTDKLGILYDKDHTAANDPSEMPRTLLTTGNKLRVAAPQFYMSLPWEAPFLYHDNQHAFYVTSVYEWKTITETKTYGRWEWVPDYQYVPKVVVKMPPMPKPPPLWELAGQPAELGDLIYGGGKSNPRILEFMEKTSTLKYGLDMEGTVKYDNRKMTPVESLSILD